VRDLRSGMSVNVDIDTGRPEHGALLARPQQQGCGIAQMIGAAAALSPAARRALLTICTMTATIMQALDTTIANVALPYMQGSLSASLDQVSWVLTSYIVAAAVMTAPVGWLADRFGRKKLFIVCVGGFTVASLLCALAQSIEQIVAFRLMQGMCGAALVPLSQSVMLDAYPIEQRGQAMGIWGVGVMLGPIMGRRSAAGSPRTIPGTGCSWSTFRSAIVTVLGLLVFMDETKRQAHLKFDWFGFPGARRRHRRHAADARPRRAARLVRLAEIVAELIISIAGFYYFFAHRHDHAGAVRALSRSSGSQLPDRLLLHGDHGLMLFSVDGAVGAVHPERAQLSDRIRRDGCLASRGLGTLVGMLIIGPAAAIFRARYLILIGLTLTALTMYQMTGVHRPTPPAARSSVIGLVQGFGMGFVFIPLSTVAFLTLRRAIALTAPRC
jgi:DHA2 family multidrug resistance protein